MAEKNPLTSINLSGNKLVLGANGKWYLESSDLDQATLEIESLVSEKEQLASSLSAALQQIEALKGEVREVNGAKSVLLEMLMKERQQRVELEASIDGFKEELRSSYKAIVEL
eukprot:gene44998-55043_t